MIELDKLNTSINLVEWLNIQLGVVKVGNFDPISFNDDVVKICDFNYYSPN